MLFTLAGVYYKGGKSGLGVETLKNILRVNPQDERSAALLAEINNGNKDRAVNLTRK